MGVIKNPIVDGANKKAVSWMYFVIYAIIIIIVVVIIVKIYNAVKDGANAVGDTIAKQAIAQQTGVSVVRQEVCEQVAVDIRDGLTVIPFANSVFNMDIDAVADAMNRLQSVEEAKITSKYFKQKNGFLISSFKNKTFISSTQLKDRVDSSIFNAL